MSWLFASGGQSIGVSASASVLPMNIQSRSPLGWTDLISLQSKGLSRVFSSTTIQKHEFFIAKPFLWSTSYIYLYMTTGKTIALTIWTFVSKVVSLLFNMLFTFVIAFLPKNKHLLISWQQSSLVSQTVKNLPAICETQTQSLGQKDPLEKGMASHSSIFAWRIPWREEPGRLQSLG